MLKQKMPILATPLNLIKMAKILAIKKKINSFKKKIEVSGDKSLSIRLSLIHI